jgi:proton-dependent oligopeptide transporter, POT family
MPDSGKTFFGHPRGLATLFFTEMWERFSYYGMRALLVLFMEIEVSKGGMGIDNKTATAIYGLYTMLVYLMALPGGWLADNFFGLRKAVFYGGCLITLGHFCLAFPSTETFFVGLLLIILGTGFLKPNISSMVGQLYTSDDQARRDAGFSIFYIGINIGATIAPIITGFLGEKINWHYGFAAAGIGMVCGLIQYKLTEKSLGTAGLEPTKLADPGLQRIKEKKIRIALWITVLALTVFVALVFNHVIVVNPVIIAQASLLFIGGSVIFYFAYIFIFEKLTTDEKRKIAVIGIFFIGSATFYGGLEQQGSTLNLFADHYTDMIVFGFRMPTSWLQSVPTLAVVVFTPIFAWLWVWLSKRNVNPSTPTKLSFGLLFMAIGFAVMMGASLVYVSGKLPLPTWLIATYVLHTMGEICLYPIGLSAVTKLAPLRLGGQMMGVWFMSLALGNLAAGLFAGEFDPNAILADPHLLVNLFWVVVKWMLIGGVVLLVLSKPIRKLMGNIR